MKFVELTYHDTGNEGDRMNNKTEWFNVAGIGIDGCEMLVSTTDGKKVTERLHYMELRARMNSHRKISLFTWGSSKEVEIDDLKTHKQRAAVIEGATKIF